ncbi:MAG: hypothetical protein K2J99_15575, partial [Lachnospiraceae bacterium]|nr:hypothetical protein [Lachnospiraceae bacterium]
PYSQWHKQNKYGELPIGQLLFGIPIVVLPEGNGHTQRIYCQQLCMNTGHFYLDFSMAGENEMLEASVESFVRRYDKMDLLIRKCIKEEVIY